MRGRRRAGDLGIQQDVIEIRRHVRAQSASENGVRRLGTQRREKQCRMRSDAASALRTLDQFLLMSSGSIPYGFGKGGKKVVSYGGHEAVGEPVNGHLHLVWGWPEWEEGVVSYWEGIVKFIC